MNDSLPDRFHKRVRVTSPLATARPPVSRSARQEIDESTAVGELYMRSLIRSQLRTALAVVTILMLSLGMLPLVFWLFEPIRSQSIGGIALPWWILGAGCYPSLVALGWLYVRQVERAERDFSSLVETESDNDLS